MTAKCILNDKNDAQEGALCDECRSVEVYFGKANRDQVHYFYMQLEQKELSYRFDIDKLDESEIFARLDAQSGQRPDLDIIKDYILEVSQVEPRDMEAKDERYINGIANGYLAKYFKHINRL